MVSLIVPVFNGEKHIRPLINCFELQKDRDFELIFVNDGSKDNSLAVLTKIKNESNLKITIINQNNSGVSVARNEGIKKAEGEFICFVDVDDQISEHYISDMHTVIKSHNTDLVICNFQTIKDHKAEIATPSDRGTGTIIVKDSIECLRDFLYGIMVTGCWSMMIRKSVITKNNLQFAAGYKYSEDLHMIWRVIAYSQKIAYLDRQLYIYKIQDNSATSRFDTERLQGYKLIKDLESFFDAHVPSFAGEYKKYAAARIAWSIAWQASVNFELKQFRSFFSEHKIKDEMKKLVAFNDKRVALSALTFLISPYIFRQMAIKLGKRYIH